VTQTDAVEARGSALPATVSSTQEELALDRIAEFPLLAACFEAWTAARAEGGIPSSLDVPTLPDAVLDYTMLLDYAPDRQVALVRLVGNYIGERAAFQAHGMTVRAFFDERDARIVTDALRRIADSRTPSLARRSHVPIDGVPMSYVRLILPLSVDGQDVTGFFKTIEPATLSTEA